MFAQHKWLVLFRMRCLQGMKSPATYLQPALPGVRVYGVISRIKLKGMNGSNACLQQTLSLHTNSGNSIRTTLVQKSQLTSYRCRNMWMSNNASRNNTLMKYLQTDDRKNGNNESATARMSCMAQLTICKPGEKDEAYYETLNGHSLSVEAKQGSFSKIEQVSGCQTHTQCL